MKIIPDLISTHMPTYTSPEGRVRVVRDWFILMVVSIFIIMFEVVWSVFFFRDNITIRAPIHVKAINVATIDKSTMQNMQAVFSKRASQQSEYESNAKPLIDPSK